MTLYGPPTCPFEKNGVDATPEASVNIVMLVELLLNVPDGPDPGAVNVTGAFWIGAFEPSLTVTASGTRKTELIILDWGVVFGFVTIEPGAGKLTEFLASERTVEISKTENPSKARKNKYVNG